MNFPNQILQFIRQERLVRKGDLIIVGISGGPDSVALGAVLRALRQELGIRLHFAHFNHQLRRGEAADAAFVKKLAQQWGVPLQVGFWEKPRIAKGSLEQNSRIERIAFLTALAKKIKADAVALGQHQDDLAETVLMRLLRGSGLEGMGAIWPRRIIEEVAFIRPLLPVSRAQILDFLAAGSLTFRLDPTNKQLDFTRNQIRHELMPLLRKQYNPRIVEILANHAAAAATDYDFIEQTARRLIARLATLNPRRATIAVDRGVLSRQHPAIQRTVLRQLIKKLKGDTRQITFAHIQNIAAMLTQRRCVEEIDLPQGLRVKMNDTQVIFKLLASA
ncbi:MAG: tRNA lysidine(34) synthetase TilS [Candidatus Omnitrophica bacterium]|nr:tRNA lysidine(34) synthetase TilS [Candidatus Omnitrophota bacterium]